MGARPWTLMAGIGFGESPRWHQDRLWFARLGREGNRCRRPRGESSSARLLGAVLLAPRFESATSPLRRPVEARNAALASARAEPRAIRT